MITNTFSKVRAKLWLLVFLGAGCFFAPLKVSAKLSEPYALQTFAPYLKHRFITRLGWQGGPVTLQDPHLYLYDPVMQTEWATLEFQVKTNQVHTVLLKWKSGAPEHLRQQVLLTFLEQSADNELSTGQLKRLMAHKCYGEWALSENLFFTYFATEQDQFFQLSRYGKNLRPTYEKNCHL